MVEWFIDMSQNIQLLKMCALPGPVMQKQHKNIYMHRRKDSKTRYYQINSRIGKMKSWVIFIFPYFQKFLPQTQLFIFLHLYVCVVNMHMYICVFMWRPKVDIRSLFQWLSTFIHWFRVNWTHSSLVWASLTGQLALKIPCLRLHLLHNGITGGMSHPPAFTWVPAIRSKLFMLAQ